MRIGDMKNHTDEIVIIKNVLVKVVFDNLVQTTSFVEVKFEKRMALCPSSILKGKNCFKI